MTLRRKIFHALDSTWESKAGAQWVGLLLVVLILVNVVAVILGTVDSISAAHADRFKMLEQISLIVFTVEYVLRIWSCVEHPNPRFHAPVWGRLRYMITPMALVDLAAIAPFFLAAFLPYDLRFMRVFRVIWLLKLTRYSRALTLLGDMLKSEKRDLLSALFIMLSMLTFASTLMYFVEHEHQPEVFRSIPAAMWWGVATLTTVGYGDVVPVSALGRLLGACIALFGVGLFALPAAIMVSGFTRQQSRQDFLTSWNLVASLPLFENLTAAQIAEIAALLEYRSTIPGETIFDRGDEASKVFFVGAGEVLIRYPDMERTFGPGSFFGELALLEDDDRKGTAICRTSCQLMVLSRNDFFELLARNQQLEEQVQAVAREHARGLQR